MGRFARGVTVLVAAALLAAPAALAATPTQIYRDYQDNGRLDGRYTITDLHAALQNPSVQGYGGPTIVPGMKQEIAKKVAEQRGLKTVKTSTGLPFTGFDLALLTIGGGLLLVIGFGLRRVSRVKR